ncbi:MAG: hypothetical protein K2J79_00235 [Ruminiclostridium sp.]|nr:hypothetical protein [Ruminiclostridium sp.]
MKITELMDNYTDNEFLIDGEPSADVEKVLQGVNAKVKVKKHLKLHTKIIIAVAAAFIGLFAITAAAEGTTFISRTGYVERWDDFAFWSDSSNDNWIEPYRVVDGRVLFTAVGEGEEEIDITDLISDEKAFYYEYSKEDSNGKSHDCVIAVGGILNDLGYAELIHLEGGRSCHASGMDHVYYMIDGNEVLNRDMTEEQYNNHNSYPFRVEEKLWMKEFRKNMGMKDPEENTSWHYPPGSN